MSNLKDYGTSTVDTAPSPADSGTTLDVATGHGSRFPSTPFYVTVHPPSQFPTLDNAEKLLVTNVSSDTLTVTRAQGDTSAQNIEAGWRISNALFFADIPATFDDLSDGTTNKAYTSTEKTKLSGIETAADVTDATNVDAAGATMNSDTTLAGNGYFLDEDSMTSNSATKVASQQSIKAYVDAAISAAKAALYPVGSYYINETDSTNPGTLLGFGTWTAVQDTMIMAVGSTYTAGTSGGSASHSHPLSDNGAAAIRISSSTPYIKHRRVSGMPTWSANWNMTNSFTINNTATDENTGAALVGNTDSKTTLPPYKTAYVWKRTA